MNNSIKYLCGTIAGIMIGGITVVGASQAIQAIQSTDIKVSLNGQIQEFKDETTGETQYPIIYNDRTYLPLRNIAQLTGLGVDYNSSNKTAILSDDSNSTIKKMIETDIKDGTFKGFFKEENSYTNIDLGIIAVEYNDYTYDEKKESYDVNKIIPIAEELGISKESVYKELDKFSKKSNNVFSNWYDPETNTMDVFYGDENLLLPMFYVRDLNIIEYDSLYMISGKVYSLEYSFGEGWGYNDYDLETYKDVGFFDFCIDNGLVNPSWSFEYVVSINNDYKYSKYKYLNIKVEWINNNYTHNNTLEDCALKYKLAVLSSYTNDITNNSSVYYLNTNNPEDSISITIYHIDDNKNNVSHFLSKGNRYIGLIKDHSGNVVGDFEVDGKISIYSDKNSLDFESGYKEFTYYNYVSEDDLYYYVDKTTIVGDETKDNKYDFSIEKLSLSKNEYFKSIKG